MIFIIYITCLFIFIFFIFWILIIENNVFNLKSSEKIVLTVVLTVILGIFFGKETYSIYKYGSNYEEINYIKKNLSEEEKLKYEYYINNLSTLEEKDKFSTYMYLKLKEKEDRRIENMVNSF